MFVSRKHILTQPASAKLQSAVMRAQILLEGNYLISTPSEVCRLQYMMQILKVKTHIAGSASG